MQRDWDMQRADDRSPERGGNVPPGAGTPALSLYDDFTNPMLDTAKWPANLELSNTDLEFFYLTIEAFDVGGYTRICL